jgi:hypothetical protein
VKDPIVEEIREIRRTLEAEFNANPDNLLEYIYAQQRKKPDRLVAREPRRLSRKGVA